MIFTSATRLSFLRKQESIRLDSRFRGNDNLPLVKTRATSIFYYVNSNRKQH